MTTPSGATPWARWANPTPNPNPNPTPTPTPTPNPSPTPSPIPSPNPNPSPNLQAHPERFPAFKERAAFAALRPRVRARRPAVEASLALALALQKTALRDGALKRQVDPGML